VNCNFMTALYQNSELTLVQCECHIGKQTVIYKEFTQLIGITVNADFTFSKNICFLVRISSGGQMLVLPPSADVHDPDRHYDCIFYVFTFNLSRITLVMNASTRLIEVE